MRAGWRCGAFLLQFFLIPHFRCLFYFDLKCEIWQPFGLLPWYYWVSGKLASEGPVGRTKCCLVAGVSSGVFGYSTGRTTGRRTGWMQRVPPLRNGSLAGATAIETDLQISARQRRGCRGMLFACMCVQTHITEYKCDNFTFVLLRHSPMGSTLIFFERKVFRKQRSERIVICSLKKSVFPQCNYVKGTCPKMLGKLIKKWECTVLPRVTIYKETYFCTKCNYVIIALISASFPLLKYWELSSLCSRSVFVCSCYSTLKDI